MAQLLVRNIEEAIVKKLRLKAAREGVSVEEEHRRILRDVLLPNTARKKKSFKECLLGLSGALRESELMDRSKDLPREIDL
jgi:plasmid stability protein